MEGGLKNQSFMSDLIYPFTKSTDFYNRIKTTAKSGKQYEFDNIYFKEIADMNEENLLRFKRCCLVPKHVIYDNGIIQIGTVTSNFTYDSENMVKLTIFIANNQDKNVEQVYLTYVFLKDMAFSVKEPLPSIIGSKSQARQDLLIKYNMIPYQILFNKLTYDCGVNSYDLSFALPVTLNKFLHIRYIEKEQFKNEWRIYKNNSSYTKFAPVDEKLVPNNIFDFKNYFNNLIELKPWNLSYYQAGIGDYKLAGSFKLGEEMYAKVVWIKIAMSPKKEISFQIYCELSNVQEYLLNTFCFLFSKK